MNTYNLRIAGVRIRILASRQIIPPEKFRPFIADDSGDADVTVEVSFGNTSVEDCGGSKIYRVTQNQNGDDIVRIESEDGRSYKLLIPERLSDSVCKSGNWLLYLPLKKVMLPFGRMIIHASAVIYRGEAYVFSAPSGSGKSTQADIWNREFGAEIINGDKVILSLENGRVIAHGGPAAGSSGIYKNICAPVAAIMLLGKSEENRIEMLSPSAAYLGLYSEALKSVDDPDFNRALLPETEKVVKNVPVARLLCRPDRSAAEYVLDWIKTQK